MNEGDEIHDKLPEGWTKKFDPKKQQFYYKHLATKKTQWHFPVDDAKLSTRDETELPNISNDGRSQSPVITSTVERRNEKGHEKGFSLVDTDPLTKFTMSLGEQEQDLSVIADQSVTDVGLSFSSSPYSPINETLAQQGGNIDGESFFHLPKAIDSNCSYDDMDPEQLMSLLLIQMAALRSELGLCQQIIKQQKALISDLISKEETENVEHSFPRNSLDVQSVVQQSPRRGTLGVILFCIFSAVCVLVIGGVCLWSSDNQEAMQGPICRPYSLALSFKTSASKKLPLCSCECAPVKRLSSDNVEINNGTQHNGGNARGSQNGVFSYLKGVICERNKK